MSKHNVYLIIFLQEGLSEPEFYGNLVYKLRKNVGKPELSEQFKKIVTRY